MTYPTMLAAGAFAGGILGYMISRLSSGNRISLASNGPIMSVGGAAAGLLVVATLSAPGPTAFGEELTSWKEFDSRVVGASRPVMVDFYAAWCGPCKALAPVLGKLEREFRGKIDFYRVDVDQAGRLARDMRIDAVPTLLLYRDGQVFSRIRGAMPEPDLRAALEALLRGE